MSTQINPTAQTNFCSALWLGARLGAKLSILYTVIANTLLAAFSPLSQNIPVCSLLLLVIIVGLLISVLPSAVIGAVTGVGIDWVVTRLRANLSVGGAFIVGWAICVSLVTIITLILVVHLYGGMANSFWGNYWFFIGAPGIIYMLAGGWLGVRSYHQETDLY